MPKTQNRDKNMRVVGDRVKQPSSGPIPGTSTSKRDDKPTGSPKQRELFNLLADFSVYTVMGWVSASYKMYTREIMRTTYLNVMMSQFAGDYFNKCAHWVYNRTDPHINEKFDKMSTIQLPEAKMAGNSQYHPIDLLSIIVAMSMQLLAKMNIGGYISDDYDATMHAVEAHLWFLARQFEFIAAGFNGCDNKEPHVVPPEGERVYDIGLRKAVMHPDGNVEIKDDWFEEEQK